MLSTTVTTRSRALLAVVNRLRIKQNTNLLRGEAPLYRERAAFAALAVHFERVRPQTPMRTQTSTLLLLQAVS
jgi:hypothetical protein